MHKLVMLMIAVPLYGQAYDRMESASVVFVTENASQQPPIECLAPRELFPSPFSYSLNKPVIAASLQGFLPCMLSLIRFFFRYILKRK